MYKIQNAGQYFIWKMHLRPLCTAGLSMSVTDRTFFIQRYTLHCEHLNGKYSETSRPPRGPLSAHGCRFIDESLWMLRSALIFDQYGLKSWPLFTLRLQMLNITDHIDRNKGRYGYVGSGFYRMSVTTKISFSRRLNSGTTSSIENEKSRYTKIARTC